MANQPINPRTNQPFRPEHLPPPTTLPLRYCSHNEESTPIDEPTCLLSLLSPNPEQKKNKEHYILATADPPSLEKTLASDEKENSSNNKNDNNKASNNSIKRRKRAEKDWEEAMRRAKSIRAGARSIPGVPVIYVKRSVMVLEPMSAPSENVRDGVEKGKFRVGLDEQSALGKRKRGESGEEDGKKKKQKGTKKAKGPNPLSVKKPKKREPEEQKKSGSTKAEKKEKEEKKGQDGDGHEPGNAARAEDGGSTAPKPKRKRRHHKSARQGNEDAATPAHEAPTEQPAE